MEQGRYVGNDDMPGNHMLLAITAFYAGLMGLWILYLGLTVVRLRRRYDVSTGHGRRSDLEQAVRAHGNACEYIPIALILMALGEGMGMPSWVVHLFGLTLVTGRLMHGWYFLNGARVLRVRVIGMLLTMGAIFVLAIGATIHGLLEMT